MHLLLWTDRDRAILRQYALRETALAKAERIAHGMRQLCRVETDGEGLYVMYDNTTGAVCGSVDVWEE